MGCRSNFQRKSIRIPGYDYTQPGAYFITLCTHDRHPVFGHISNAIMTLSIEGEIAFSVWQRTEILRPEVRLDHFVVMPLPEKNSLHRVRDLWARSSGRINLR